MHILQITYYIGSRTHLGFHIIPEIAEKNDTRALRHITFTQEHLPSTLPRKKSKITEPVLPVHSLPSADDHLDETVICI